MVVAGIRSSRLQLGVGNTETFAPSSTAGINSSCGKALNVAAVVPPTTGRLPVDRGLNYESGLNLKAIDNGPKMVTMDWDYTKVRAEPRA